MIITAVECKDDLDLFQVFLDLPKSLYKTDFATNTPSITYLKSCFLFFKNNVPVGRYALYDNPHLLFNAKKSMCIGSYEAIDDKELVNFIRMHIREQMKLSETKVLIGPMEGSTMNNYRFSKKETSRNFFLEPYHPIYYNKHFKSYGFQSIAEYYSNIISIEEFEQDRIDSFESDLERKGLKFRKIDMDNFSEDLDGFIELVAEGFTQNFLYTPINSKLLKEKYLAMEHLIDKELLCAIEDKSGKPQVMFFGYKDLYDPKGETVVFKTVVKRPGFEMKGLARYLDEKFIQNALEQGYTKMVHAFMYFDNITKKLSNNRKSEELKEYALYALEI